VQRFIVSEMSEDILRTAQMAGNLHRGFHELFPAEEGPIKQYRRWHPDFLG
jgi:hypothetical protein